MSGLSEGLRLTLAGLAVVLSLCGCSSGDVTEYADVIEHQRQPEPVDSPDPTGPPDDGFGEDNWTEDEPDAGAKHCEDVTSYDYNWDNDMLCTRPDGSTFYTDYDGARAYLAQ